MYGTSLGYHGNIPICIIGNYTDTETVKIPAKTSVLAVSGDWMLRNPENPYHEAIKLPMGQSHTFSRESEVVLYVQMPNKFCYKDTEGHGRMFAGLQNTDAQGRRCLDSLCRNPDGDTRGPYCLVKDGVSGKQIKSSCGIPKCIWDVECYSGNGVGYRGNENTVPISKEKSVPCQSWTADRPHINPYHPTEYNSKMFGIGKHNSCRNPDPKTIAVPWCYTSNFRVRWGPCVAVKQCDATIDYFQRDL